jgi:hypothetical protein
MRSAIEADVQKDRRQSELLRRLNRGLKRISVEAYGQIMGVRSPKSLVEDLKDVAAIDMSGVGSEEKLSFFVSLADHLLDQMQAGESLKLALIIDEAPQYCPWEPKELQQNATENQGAVCSREEASALHDPNFTGDLRRHRHQRSGKEESEHSLLRFNKSLKYLN